MVLLDGTCKQWRGSRFLFTGMLKASALAQAYNGVGSRGRAHGQVGFNCLKRKRFYRL